MFCVDQSQYEASLYNMYKDKSQSDQRYSAHSTVNVLYLTNMYSFQIQVHH